MKKILLTAVLFIAISNSSMAQNEFCKDIVRSASDNAILYTAPTPGPAWITKDNYSFSIIKGFNEAGATVVLSVGAKSKSDDLTRSTLNITFEDKTEINIADIPVKKGTKSDDQYYYTGIATLSVGDLDKLKKSKVTSFIFVDNLIKPFVGNFKTKLMAYANCMDSFNDTFKAPVNANEKKSIDGFWGIPFGASITDVKTAIAGKGGKFSADNSTPNELSFENAVFTQRNTDFISTKFINSKFYEAVVVFPEFSDTQLIPTFNTIVSELVNVYGPAKITKTFEKPFEEGDGYEVTAIKSGKAGYYANWKTNNGNKIIVQINKTDSISIFYTSANLEKAKEAVKSNDY